MRTLLLSRKVICLLLTIALTVPINHACAKQDANTVKVVKPKGKKRPYNPKKDKGKKRTKKVKMNN